LYLGQDETINPNKWLRFQLEFMKGNAAVYDVVSLRMVGCVTK